MTNDELPLYRIVDWNETFENAKSREVRQPSHVYKPNKMGIGLMNILVEQDGDAIYGNWVLILDLVSRQKKPRNGYLTADGRANGRRYRVAELAYLFRRTEAAIRRCLKMVTSPEVAWMVIENSGAQGIRESDTSVSAAGAQGIRESDTSGDQSIREESNTPELKGLHHADTSGSQGIRESDTSGDQSIPITEQKEQKEPPPVPQGTETNGYKELSIPELQEWFNSLFGRQRAWSYEEMQLLTEIAPVEKKDRALLSWAYKMAPRDNEGWVLVGGQQVSKPKQNLIALLREFSSEIDKWKSVRGNGTKKESITEPLSDAWVNALRKKYGADIPIPKSKHLLAPSVQHEIEAAIREEAA